MTFLREPLQVVEIEQPLCSRTFGVSPCLATGTECWNTRATCKYLAALDMTDTLILRFVKPDANRRQDTGFDPSTAIPSLRSVDTAPTVLNVASGDSDFSPLGLRAVANIVIDDHPYNDAGIDPYLSARAYDVAAQGTFWGRWLARNPYHVGYAVRVYDGFVGDDLAAMIKREYFVESIDRTSRNVRITAKDVLRKITDTDHKSPEASTGVLASGIAFDSTTLIIAGANISDYPTPGRVRIGSEVIGYTIATDVGGGNFALSGLTRGDLGTAADGHGQNDGVQWVLSYEAVRYDSILNDLIVTRAGVPSAYVDAATWSAEATKWRPLYIMTRHITTPTSTHKLVGEVVQQSQSHLWWDERQQAIRLEAQRPNYNPNMLTDADHIVAGSFSIKEEIKDRASTVYVYYGLRNPTLSTTDPVSYSAAEVLVDADSVQSYGEPATKVIYAPWISSAALARSIATKYVRRFRDARRKVALEVTPKDIGDWTGNSVLISHWQDQISDGSPALRAWLITSAETVDHGARYKLTLEDNESAGTYWEWADAATDPVDWWAATPAERDVIGFWCDSNGLDPGGNPMPFRWL